MRLTNVLLVDSQPNFRAGVKCVLEETGRYRVVAQAGPSELAHQLRGAPDFDLLLLNARLPHQTAIQMAQLLSAREAAPRIVVLSKERDHETVEAAARAGAAAILPRDTTSAELISILDRVVEGEKVFVIPMRPEPGALGQPHPDGTPAAAKLDGDDRLHLLSVLEVQVLTGVAQGLSIPDIAAMLAIPAPMVEQYLHSVLHKLDVEDAAQAVRHARRHGWIPSPPPAPESMSPPTS